MVDRVNAVYTDDGDKKWLVKNVAKYVLKLGFEKYDATKHKGIPELPPGYKMRRVNLVSYSDGQTRRRSLPIGDFTNPVYQGKATVAFRGPGLDKDGKEVDDVNIVYSVSSTAGELRSFIVETDPGYTSLVANDNITEVKPPAEA